MAHTLHTLLLLASLGLGGSGCVRDQSPASPDVAIDDHPASHSAPALVPRHGSGHHVSQIQLPLAILPALPPGLAAAPLSGIAEAPRVHTPITLRITARGPRAPPRS